VEYITKVISVTLLHLNRLKKIRPTVFLTMWSIMKLLNCLIIT